MNTSIVSSAAATLSGYLLICLPIMSVAANTVPQKWQLNVPSTNANFMVEYFGSATVEGQFHKVDGSISYDMKKPTSTTITFKVDTNSVDTGLSIRDSFLRRKELLNTAQYPTLTFVSKKIQMITPKEAKVTGDFTALGQTRPLTVRVTLSDVETDPVTKQPILRFKATGRVNRNNYGVTAFPSLVGTMIPLEITGKLTPAS